MELIFSKLLTQTDIERRLSVPTNVLHMFPFIREDRQANLHVKDRSGASWTFRCICRDGIYAKPVFSKGWLEFVYAKKLKINDKVEFYREKEEQDELSYRVEVKRKVLRLMGEDIWIEIDLLHLYGVD